MIHKIGILILICLFTACSSSGQNEIPTTGELLRQAAFYRERLQFLPALETYRQAIGQAEKEKDSVALSIAYLETGKIYRKQSLKQKALENENVALSYILNPASDSLRLELYREIGDVYSLSGQADSAFYYYEKAGCRIKQAKILQQNGSYKEAETLLKEESGQTIPRKEKAEIYLALADLQIALGKLDEAEKNLSEVPSSHPHLYAALSRIAQSRGDSLQADFYHKSYLHHLSVLRQEKEQNQITQLLRTSEQKEWEKRLSNTQRTNICLGHATCLLQYRNLGIFPLPAEKKCRFPVRNRFLFFRNLPALPPKRRMETVPQRLGRTITSAQPDLSGVSRTAEKRSTEA